MAERPENHPQDDGPKSRPQDVREEIFRKEIIAEAMVGTGHPGERRARLKGGVFKLTSAKKIATSLKRSAERSSRRKCGAYRSALSMLTFYINRAGKTCRKRNASGWSAQRWS